VDVGWAKAHGTSSRACDMRFAPLPTLSTVSASHDRVGKGAIVLLLYERSAKRLYPPYESSEVTMLEVNANRPSLRRRPGAARHLASKPPGTVTCVLAATASARAACCGRWSASIR